MCEKEIEIELEQQLSEREDLIAQLNEQDKIMKIMKQQLKKCNMEKEDYTQVVFQLQRQGKFLNQGKLVLIIPYFRGRVRV